MSTALPKTDVARVLGKQVFRSGTSVGANHREVDSARSKAEFISKMGDSLKDISETAYWLELLIESHTVSSTKMTSLLEETHELQAIFATIIRKAKD